MDVNAVMRDFRAKAETSLAETDLPDDVRAVFWDLNVWLHKRLRDEMLISGSDGS